MQATQSVPGNLNWPGTPNVLHKLGPFASSTDAVYLVGCTTTTTISIAVSADPDTTAFALFPVSWEPFAGRSVHSLWVVQRGDILHFCVQMEMTTSGLLCVYRTFDMATNTWGTVETVKPTLTNAYIQLAGKAAMVIRSDGSIVVMYTVHVRAGGQDYARIRYAIRSTSGTWTNNLVLDDNTANRFEPADIMVADDNRVHFIYVQTTVAPFVLKHRSLSSAGVLSSPVTIVTEGQLRTVNGGFFNGKPKTGYTTEDPDTFLHTLWEVSWDNVASPTVFTTRGMNAPHIGTVGWSMNSFRWVNDPEPLTNEEHAIWTEVGGAAQGHQDTWSNTRVQYLNRTERIAPIHHAWYRDLSGLGGPRVRFLGIPGRGRRTNTGNAFYRKGRKVMAFTEQYTDAAGTQRYYFEITISPAPASPPGGGGGGSAGWHVGSG